MKIKAAIVLLLALAAAGCGGSGEPKAVPDLRGQRLDVAEQRLDSLGLEYEEVGGGAFGIVVRSNWEVCDQKPKPGAKATTVELVVDRVGACPPPPPKLFAIPDLVDEPLAEAEAELKGKKIPYSLESWDGRPIVKAGAEVCDQEPVGGRKAARVTLYVARDCEPVVPDVVGEDLEDAEDVVRDAGIRLKVVGFKGAPGSKAFWTVCEQEPDPGETADALTLYVKRAC